MTKDVTLPNGVVVSDVPENMTYGGVLDMAAAQGIITPREAAESLGDFNRVEDPGFRGAAKIAAGEELMRLATWGGTDPDITAQLRRDRPGATMLGTMAPYLATAPLSGGLATQAGIGAGLGFLGSQGDVGEAAKGALFSAAGYGVGQLAGRVANRIRGMNAAVQNTDEASRLLSRAQELGFELTPGQVTGSGILRRVEAALQSNPLTAGAYDRIVQSNQRLLNRYAARTIGSSAEDVGIITRDAAATRIGDVFNRLGDDVGEVTLDRGFVDGVRRLGLQGRLLRDDLGEMARFFDEAGEASEVIVDGQMLMRLRSRLGKKMAEAWRKGEDELGEAASRYIDDIDDIIASQVPEESIQRFSAAREQWRNLKVLERGNSITAEGNVNALSAYKAFNKVYGERGGGRFGETSDFADALRATASRSYGGIVPTVGPGTAEKLAGQAMLGGGAAIATGIAGGDFQDAAMAGGAMALAPLAGRGLIAAGVGRPSAAAAQAGAAIGRAGGAATSDD